VRRTVLIANPSVELETVHGAIRPGLPYMMSYAGGELCPHHTTDDGFINRFHNFSLIACVL